MLLTTTIFWISLFIVVFTYLGYGLLAWAMVKLRGARIIPEEQRTDAELPEVTLLIACYNEADILDEKVANCRALDYPEGKLKCLFITDGSSDHSAEILRKETGLIVLHSPERRGKIAAVKRAMKTVTSPITVLTDANTFLNPHAIRRMVADFQDPTVGAVAGQKRVISQGDASSGGEGLYWKYESFLKRKDSQWYSVVGAAGELYAIRTALFHQVPADTILDDFMHTLLIAKDGYRVTYAPDAVAEEYGSANVKEELKRKIRICAGGWQSMGRLLPLLNPFRYGVLSIQYIGHRVLRWSLGPLLLPVVLLTNSYLVAQGAHWIYSLLLFGQVAFYTLAFVGYLWRERKLSIPGFFAPYYFVVMNYSVYAGFLRFWRGKQAAAWEKSERREKKVVV
jgi:cellulose synthase/poly-beta-1,6-N-acetylglucosamine synthase-like glycosyltransferase